MNACRRFVVLVGLLTSLSVSGQNGFQAKYNEARNAYKNTDYAAYYAAILEATKLHPYHQGVLYHCGIAAALNNKPERAIQYLRRAIQINASFDLSVADLNSLADRTDFAKLLDEQKQLLQPVITSDTAFVIDDRSLHIECIAAGVQPGEFYLGSIHAKKIVKVEEGGEVRDFVTPGANGLTSIFGIKVDSKNNLLWACSSPLPETSGFDSTMQSAVFKFDLRSAELLKKYSPPDSKEHLFGDLTLSPSDEVYVSDSKTNEIFKIDPKTDQLVRFYTNDQFWNLQGITFSEDEKHLFIADYIKGIFALELKTMKLHEIGLPQGFSLKGVDGLTYFNNSLIAIQNAVTPMRVTQYHLSTERNAIHSARIIDKGHPAFNEPTIGCLSGKQFYYVANSLWSGYQDNHTLKPAEQLQKVVVLKSGLK